MWRDQIGVRCKTECQLVLMDVWRRINRQYFTEVRPHRLYFELSDECSKIYANETKQWQRDLDFVTCSCLAVVFRICIGKIQHVLIAFKLLPEGIKFFLVNNDFHIPPPLHTSSTQITATTTYPSEFQESFQLLFIYWEYSSDFSVGFQKLSSISNTVIFVE